jgi:hypothetical protein
MNYQAVRAGRLTDWGGTHIDRRILSQLRAGNIIRIYIGDRDLIQSMYIRITKICGSGKYRGRAEDPYWNGIPGILFTNGDMRTFNRSHVCEIPLTWKGNSNLIRAREARKR